MHLDALVYIKDKMDSTLSFRRSCREGICGSCSMTCDGTHTLACISKIGRDVKNDEKILPLGNMFIYKDLIVDMSNFYHQYRQIEPFLKTKKTLKPPKDGDIEKYQSVKDRDKLNGLYDCVLCACCSTACPTYWWFPEKFLGPSALLNVNSFQ